MGLEDLKFEPHGLYYAFRASAVHDPAIMFDHLVANRRCML